MYPPLSLELANLLSFLIPLRIPTLHVSSILKEGRRLDGLVREIHLALSSGLVYKCEGPLCPADLGPGAHADPIRSCVATDYLESLCLKKNRSLQLGSMHKGNNFAKVLCQHGMHT